MFYPLYNTSPLCLSVVVSFILPHGYWCILHCLLVVFLSLVCFSSIGVVFAFVSNEKLNDSVQGFNTTVNTALDTSINFIDDTQMVG